MSRVMVLDVEAAVNGAESVKELLYSDLDASPEESLAILAAACLSVAADTLNSTQALDEVVQLLDRGMPDV